jgi:hypothetical protein
MEEVGGTGRMTRLITGPDIGQSQDSSARTIVTQQPKVEPWANSNIGTQTLMEFTYLTVIKGDF